MAYADYTFYAETYGGTAPEVEVAPLLERASEDIDVVTFCRINAVGWDRLTTFQRNKVQLACCQQADFLLDNADAVGTALSSYAINGVSMSWGNSALYQVVQGVPMANAAMGLLRQTGLTALMAYPPEVDRALA